MVNWQKDCATRRVAFTCPLDREVISTYEPFQWPRLLVKKVFDVAASMDSRDRDRAAHVASLEGQLQVIEQQRNTLVADKAQIQAELEGDQKKQRVLQDLLNELRSSQTSVLKAKDDEMQKLQAQIKAMEQEKRQIGDTELAAARAKMRDLENDRKERDGREQELRRNIQALEQDQARHKKELQDKDSQLEELKQRRNRVLVESGDNFVNDNNSAQSPRPASPTSVASAESDQPLQQLQDAPQSPLYDSIIVGGKWVQSVWSSPLVSGSVHHGGKAIKAVTKFVRGAWSPQHRHAALLGKESSYRLQERRGNHYASPVWKAVVVDTATNDSDGDALVAIKFRPKGRDAFREAMLLHQLAHPNIIGLVGVFESQLRPENTGLVLPYVELDLEFWLGSGNAAQVMKQRDSVIFGLVAGISYVHQNNVVHRALAPASILLELGRDDVLRPRVASWTNAVSLASDRLPPLIARGYRYRAPELALFDEAQISNWKAVDVWAVGAIVWELLTRTNKEHLPIVSDGTPNVILEQMLVWSELRDAATRSQGEHPAVKRAVAKAATMRSRSLLSQLELIPESMRSLFTSLLAWDPASRVPLADALLFPALSQQEDGTVGPDQLGHFVQDPRVLSDSELTKWMALHVAPETQ